MEVEDIYEIGTRIQNARALLIKGDIERAKRVLLNVERDLCRVILFEEGYLPKR